MLGSCFVSCRRSAFPINDFEIWAPWKWEEPPPVALNPLWDSTYTCFPNLNYARTGTCFGVGGVKVHAWRSDKVSVSQLFFHFRVYFLTSIKCDLQSYLSWDLVLLTALSWHQMALALMKQCAFPTSPTASPDHADPAYFQHSVSSICRMCLSEEALICNSDRSSSDACADGFPSHALMHYFVHDAQLGRRLSRYLTGLCYLSASSQLPPPPPPPSLVTTSLLPLLTLVCCLPEKSKAELLHARHLLYYWFFCYCGANLKYIHFF